MADARTLITEWESIDPVEFPTPLELKPLLVDDSEKLILKEYEVVLINTKLKGRLFITNFRTIFLCGVSTNYIELGSIPLTSIESVEKIVDVNQDVKLRSALRQADKNLSQRLVLTSMILIILFQKLSMLKKNDIHKLN